MRYACVFFAERLDLQVRSIEAETEYPPVSPASESLGMMMVVVGSKSAGHEFRAIICRLDHEIALPILAV